MKKWKAIAAVCLIFLLGVLAGGLATVAAVHHHVRHVLQGGPDAVTEVVVRRLTRDLRLDAEQREKLQGITAATRTELKAVRREVQPRVMQILAVAEKKVREILKPEQMHRFDELVAQGRARWERID